jgi:hypothetical protein
VSCNKNDISVSSTLTIVFDGIKSDEISEMKISLFSTDYPEIALYEDLKPDNEGEVVIENLNSGTYFYTHPVFNCSGYCQEKVVFQINEGKDKTINIPRISFCLRC